MDPDQRPGCYRSRKPLRRWPQFFVAHALALWWCLCLGAALFIILLRLAATMNK